MTATMKGSEKFADVNKVAQTIVATPSPPKRTTSTSPSSGNPSCSSSATSPTASSKSSTSEAAPLKLMPRLFNCHSRRESASSFAVAVVCSRLSFLVVIPEGNLLLPSPLRLSVLAFPFWLSFPKGTRFFLRRCRCLFSPFLSGRHSRREPASAFAIAVACSRLSFLVVIPEGNPRLTSPLPLSVLAFPLLLSYPKGTCVCLCHCRCLFSPFLSGCHSRREPAFAFAVAVVCSRLSSLVVIPEWNPRLPLPLPLSVLAFPFWLSFPKGTRVCLCRCVWSYTACSCSTPPIDPSRTEPPFLGHPRSPIEARPYNFPANSMKIHFQFWIAKNDENP